MFKHICIAFLLLTSISSVYAQDDADRSKYRLLWEIKGPNMSGPSYLFGSMHVRDAAVFEFPDSLLHFLQTADAFASEVQFDSAMYLMLQYQFRGFHDDFEIEDALFDILEPQDSVWEKTPSSSGKSEQKERVNAFMELLSSKNDSIKSYPTMLDSYLMDLARSNGKPIYGLENLEEQMGSIFAEEASEDVENDNFSGSLRAASDFSLLKKAYLSGDLDRIWYIMQKMDSLEVWDLERRNYHMVRSLQRLMPKQRIFAVVGAAHLPGPHGILRLLERRGYEIRPVSAQFSQLTKTVAPTLSPAYRTYYSPQKNFLVELPDFVVPFQSEFGATGFVHIDIGKGLYYQVSMHDFLRIDDEDIEDTFFGEEVADIASRDTVATAPWQIIEYISEPYDSEENFGNYRARVYFQHGRAYLVYVAAYLYEQLFHPEAEYFLNSFQAAKMQRGFRTIVDSTAAFQVRMPANTRHYTLLENDYDVRDSAYQYRIRIYQGANPQSGSRYLLRWMGLSPGEGVKQTDDFLWHNLNFIERYYETTIDSTRLTKGVDSLSYTGTLSLNDSLDLDYLVMVRGNRAIVLACEKKPGENEALRFLDSFSSFAQQEQAYGPVSMLDDAFSIFMPQPVVHTQEDYSSYQESAVQKDYFYYTTDTLNSMTYFVTLSEHSPLHRMASEEQALQKMQENFLDAVDTVLHQKTIELADGSISRDLWIASEGTHMQHRAVLYPMGRYTVERYVYGTPDQLTNERLDTFLYKMPSLPDSISHTSLFSSKLDDILQHIASGDSVARAKVERVVDLYATSREEANLLQKMLQEQQEKEVLLLRLLAQRPTEEMYAFYQEIYPSVASNKSLREVILADLSEDRKKASLDLFIKLLLNSPSPTEAYTSVFASFFDSTELVNTYYPDLIAAFQKEIYPQFIYYLSEQALSEGSLVFSQDEALPLIQAGGYMLETWKPSPFEEQMRIQQMNPVYVMDYYEAAELAGEKMSEQLLAFAKKWPEESNGFKAMEVLLQHGRSVPRRLIVRMAKSENNYLKLLVSLSQQNQLDRLPSRLYEESRIARLMLDRDFAEYGVSAKNIREDGRFTATFQGKEVAYYRFRFNDEDTKNRLAVVAAFPAEKHEQAVINLQLVNYSYASVRASNYEDTAKELLEEMEDW